MNKKRTIKKSLVLSKEVIRLNTYESIIQFKTPVRPLISRLTPIPVSFVCIFCGWSLHTNMVVHIFAYGKKWPSHSRKHTNKQIIPQLKVTVYLVLLGYQKVLGTSVWRAWPVKIFLKEPSTNQKHSQCFLAPIHVCQSNPTLNESSAFFTKR